MTYCHGLNQPSCEGAALPGSSSRRPRLALLAPCVAAMALAVGGAAFGQVASTLNGPPIQMQPYVSEPGVPAITITPGTLNPFPGGGAGGAAGAGGPSGGNVSGSSPLNTMLSMPWGVQSVTAVESIGVNPSAVAATCVLESGCVNPTNGGAYVGAFQMGTAAFHDGLQAAVAANPALASQIVQGDAGRMDPFTESIAAGGYQMLAAQSLQNAGIADPTVLQTRGFYNFGPSNAVPLATADPSWTMSAAMPNVSAATLKANGVTPGETVGQWQSSIAQKIGDAANQPVLGT